MKWGRKWGLKWGLDWFGSENELYNLLPAFHQWFDGGEDGDLWKFLKLFSEDLDLTKASIERIPILKCIELCPAQFLPYLAAGLGMAWDYQGSTGPQRRRLRDIIGEYHRRGTIPYLERRIYAETGTRAKVTEGHKHNVRLNSTGRGFGMYITGPRWGQAVYQVVFEDLVRDTEIEDHPAGTGLYFLQRAGAKGPGVPDYVAVGEGDDTFVDPENPPQEDGNQASLRTESARVKYYREAYLAEDPGGDYLVAGTRYSISTSSTSNTARFFRFLGWMANGTIKEYGFFQGGEFIPGKLGNYARFGLYNDGGEVLDPGVMVSQKNIPDFEKDHHTTLEFIYLMD